MGTPEKVQRKGFKARQEAMKRLLEAHAEEWETILAEERKKVGLFPKIRRKTRDELEKELASMQEELQRLRHR